VTALGAEAGTADVFGGQRPRVQFHIECWACQLVRLWPERSRPQCRDSAPCSQSVMLPRASLQSTPLRDWRHVHKFSTSSIAQIGAIVLGGIAGLILCRGEAAPDGGSVAVPIARRTGLVMLSLFFVILIGLPVLRSISSTPGVALFEAFYRSGALVFGGGHVVLPLLREAFVTPGWVSDDVFLAGYGAAQAVPGPLFTFAAYLGTVVNVTPHGVPGAVLGLLGIFLPGILVLMARCLFGTASAGRPGRRP
jgi:Chromate transporter